MIFDPFLTIDSMFAPRGRSFLPAADVTVSETDLVLTMDLPGLTAGDLDLQVLDGHLVLRGERKRPEPSEGSRFMHSERLFGAFERRIKLPEGVDPEAITASMDNGVLSLIVPKPEKLKPRAIEIQSGGDRQLTAGAA
jgi:HSP20 family protein